MALMKEMLLPLARAIVKHTATGPVYAFGDQASGFTYTYARDKLLQAGLLQNADVKPMACHTDDRFVSFFTVLEMLNVRPYYDIDLNGLSAIQCDLGKPLPPSLESTAGLVIDIGTSEHVFNCQQVFQNVVYLLRRDGIVVHISPVTYYDHGFFNFNPRLFKEFYGLNSFDILEHDLILTPFERIMQILFKKIALPEFVYVSKYSPFSVLINDRNYWFRFIHNNFVQLPSINLFFMARKCLDDSACKIPFQV